MVDGGAPGDLLVPQIPVSMATSIAFLIFGMAFVLSMLVAVMIKVIYLTVRHFSTPREKKP